jgi:hypothetical protein
MKKFNIVLKKINSDKIMEFESDISNYSDYNNAPFYDM